MSSHNPAFYGVTYSSFKNLGNRLGNIQAVFLYGLQELFLLDQVECGVDIVIHVIVPTIAVEVVFRNLCTGILEKDGESGLLG